MEYSNDKVMTRKEYLKSKNKKYIDFSKIKRVLILIVIILLSVYLFKQLNVYNKVTKAANAVVEKNALAKTMTMYYVADSYTKDDVKAVMYYKSSDESRTKIENTENMSKIKVLDNILYGIKEQKLYSIDLNTKQIELLIDEKISNYSIYDGNIYYLGVNGVGIYKYNIDTKESVRLVKDKIYQMEIANDYIYVIAKGNTKQSIIRYNLSGKDKQVLSVKYIVSYFYLDNANIYFINANDSKLYTMSKDGKNITKITSSQVTKPVVTYENQLYYINKKDGNLYKLDLATKKATGVINKNITSMQIDGNIIYYMLKDGIGVYKLDVLTGKTTQVTSARTTEYICKN